jgi:anti-sigma regulatory factor (Ser/Thr protein kinase)
VNAVITVPSSLDDLSFEQVLDQVSAHPPDATLLLDARRTRWATPYGLTALLALAQSREKRPTLTVPELDKTASYWATAGFFHHAESLYDLAGAYPKRPAGHHSNVLLGVTPVAKSDDVHSVVDRIQESAKTILTTQLNLDPKATLRFTMMLSELCQNIVEHAGQPGWVCVQTYTWTQRLGRKVAVIAVSDPGAGFRQSLESTPSFMPPSRWDDGAALEMAVIQGTSRFRDRGRGHGLAESRRYLRQWDGKLSVRSGTARIAISPDWDQDVPLKRDLAPFTGSHVQAIIPERVAQETGR